MILGFCVFLSKNLVKEENF